MPYSLNALAIGHTEHADFEISEKNFKLRMLKCECIKSNALKILRAYFE